MNESDFWQIVDQARLESSSISDRPERLKQLLVSRSVDEIQEFSELYQDIVLKAYTWPLWGAAYVISGGCSDDGFDYFRDWLISEGREVYDQALLDPESLSSLDQLEEPELEEFRYVAYQVYEEKTGHAIVLRDREYPAEPTGEEWDEDTVETLFPKLASKYW